MLESGNQRQLLRAGAYGLLVWERLWPLVVPLFIVAVTFFTFSWIGGWRWLASDTSQALPWIVRAGFVVLAMASLWPLRLMKQPSKEDINRRIEQHSGLAHRPITVVGSALL
ncbi:MAG: DUF4175 family protein, partial [Pseudomonadota bacterium]